MYTYGSERKSDSGEYLVARESQIVSLSDFMKIVALVFG